MTTWVLAMAAVLVGFLSGWAAATATGKIIKADSIASRPDVIAEFMSKVVNIEQLEHDRKMARLRMLQSGRRTVRYDSGDNAKVMRMRKRRTVIRKSIDNA